MPIVKPMHGNCGEFADRVSQRVVDVRLLWQPFLGHLRELEREGARIVFGRMEQPLPTWEPFGDEAALLRGLAEDHRIAVREIRRDAMKGLKESGQAVVRLTHAFASHEIWKAGLSVALEDPLGENPFSVGEPGDSATGVGAHGGAANK